MLRSRVDSEIQKLEANNLARARSEVTKLAKEYGVPVSSLIEEVEAKQPRRKKTLKSVKKVPPKFRHPEDTSLTWSGRGMKPKWMTPLLENGFSLEDLR